MGSNFDPKTVVEEIAARQDDVLAQLDSLNMRVEDVLKQWTRQREGDGDAEPADGSQSGSADSTGKSAETAPKSRRSRRPRRPR